MENNDIEHLLSLTGEHFFAHIEQIYGKLVGKILRYHDIDAYTILNKVDKHELIDLFEKPDDENSTSELINLKKEICNIYKESISLKIGTKNKVILLLKSTQHIIKKKNFQLAFQTQSQRVDKYRSTSASTKNNLSDSDNECSDEKYYAAVEESIESLLTKLQNNIHGINYTNISAKDFKIIIGKKIDHILPVGFIQCICGDTIKLYLRNNRFQVSNFMKHLKYINNKPTILMNDYNKESDDPEVQNQMELGEQMLRSENIQSSTQNKTTKTVHVDIDDSNVSALIRIKKNNSQVQNSRLEPTNDTNSALSVKTAKNRHDEQALTRIQAKASQTQSSISFISAAASKNQFVNYQQKQTTNLPPKYQHSQSLKEQILNPNISSQSKKRKADEDDLQIVSYSSKKSIKKVSEQNISYSNTNSSDILCTLLNTIDINRHRSFNNYRYPIAVLRFAACLFILAGVYVYEYIRINMKFLLPSIETVKKYYTYNPYSEGKFRFDESKNYLDSINCQFVFISEDSSAIIPRVEYDSIFNNFNGLVTPVLDGKPIENAFNCQSFEELKFLIENNTRANLVNIHCLQPIFNQDISITSAATVLAAYGTDNKLTSMDIIKRWVMIYQQLHSRNIRVLGFSTDGDPKIKIPSSWSFWYYLKPTQIFMFMQDGVHLCTKIRNRLLSKNAKLKMGLYEVSINHLYELIKTTNKLDHNLSKSDLNIRDKQNFSSCQRISDDKVLHLLSLNDQYKGTYNYLLLLNLLIIAYTQSKISLSTRIFYAWIVLFFIRLWRIWLHITKRTRKFSNKKKKQNEKNYFITPNALLSIELNAHYLIYLYFLIEQKLVPESTANSVHLFSSQPCENVFRDARALSGIYSTRINFTMKQFLKRINKLNSLTELKQFEFTNKQEKINFPVHHKNKRFNNQTKSNFTDEDTDFNSNNVETIILRAYEAAQQMTIFVGISKDLIKYNLFNIQQSSELTEKLLKLNNLTESEILIIDDGISEDSDEEDGFKDGDFEEDDYVEDGDVEGDNYVEDGDEEVYDSAEDGDIENSDDSDSVEEINDNVFDYYSSEDDTEPTPSFENLQGTSYSGLRLTKSVSTTNAHKYFSVNIHNKKMFLHKATAAWYLQDRQTRLSCDRVKRVQLKESLD
ncbi:unnamed protein product [Rotaria sordida]|uniref:Uncharacterized protein n=1 Tax=Rotaria sordida TaxID=392033 RepID=A0A819KUP1_9BILA|nr:unnamed protein product [Rotaria sordida]CAF3952388.1 unnamed protein product [Rotaria sordida]